MEFFLEWWKIKTLSRCAFLIILVIVTKALQNVNCSMKGAGHTVTWITVCFEDRELPKLLPQPPYQELLLGGTRPGALVCSGISHGSSAWFTWDLHRLISSSRELVCDEWFAIQSLLPCCPIAFFIVLLGALPEITIKSKPLRAFYWGWIWTDFWWDLCSFRITVVFWMFSKHV